MPAGDVYSLRLNYLLFNQKLVNVFHYRQTSVDGTGDPRDRLAAAFINDRVGLINNMSSNDLTIPDCGVRRVAPTVTQEKVIAVGGAGNVVDDGMPAQVAVCVTLYAVSDGRRSIGRLYMPGLAKEDASRGRIEEDHFNGSLLSFVNVLNDPLVDAVNSWDFIQCIYSPTDGIARDVVAVERRPRTRILRSRTVGQGV